MLALLLLKTTDGITSESGVLLRMRAEEQKTAAASALAGGGLLWVPLRGSVSVTASLTAWKNEGRKKKKIKSNPHNQIRISLFCLFVSFVSTFSVGK